MLNLVKSNLLEILLISLSGSLIFNRATWPASLVIVAVLGYKAFIRHMDSVKVENLDEKLKERIASLESRITMLGMSKR